MSISSDLPLSEPSLSEKERWVKKTRTLLRIDVDPQGDLDFEPSDLSDLDGLSLTPEVGPPPLPDDRALPSDDELAEQLADVRDAVFDLRSELETLQEEIDKLEELSGTDKANPSALEAARNDHRAKAEALALELRDEARLVRQRSVVGKVTEMTTEVDDQYWELTKWDGELEQARLKATELADEAEELARTVGDKVVLVERANEALDEVVGEIPELSEPVGKLAAARRALIEARKERDRMEGRLQTAVEALAKYQAQLDAIAGGHGDITAAPRALDGFTRQSDRVRDLAAALREQDDVCFEKKREARRAASTVKWALERVLPKLQLDPNRAGDLRRIAEARKQLKEAEAALALEKEKLAKKETALHETESLELDLRAQAARLKLLPDVLRVGALLGAFLHREALREVEVWTESADRLAEVLDTDSLAELQELSREFLFGVEKLVANGMSPEALKALYADQLEWPERWWPPRLRAQERNWVEVEAMLRGKKSGVPEPQIKGFGDYLVEGVLEVQAPVLNNVEEVVETLQPSWEDASKYWAPALEGISVLLSGATIWKAAGGKDDGTVRDPVAVLLEADQALQTKVTISREVLVAVRTGLNMTRTQELVSLVPGVGAISELGELAANAMRTFQSWSAARADAAVHQQALEQSSRLEASADLVAKRAKSLALRSSSTTAANAITLAGYLCEICGVTAPVGTVIRGVGAGIKAGVKGVSKLFDLSRAGRAKEVLEKARAGDPKAREEVFRHHGRYACALVALLAHEGDPMARTILQNHELTEEDIQKSFPLMLKRYLMVKLEETDEPTSWSDVAKGLTWLGGEIQATAASVAELVRVGGNWTVTWAKGHSDGRARLEAELTMVAFGADTAATVERGVRQLEEWRVEYHRLDDLIDELEERYGDDDDRVLEARKAQAQVARMHDEGIDVLGEQRAEIAATMKAALGLLEKLTALSDTPGPDSPVLGPRTEARFRALVGQYNTSLLLLLAFK